MTDFKILEDILHYGEKDEKLERRYACPAMGLFYVKGTREIVPLAIQFYQEPSETNPIWTPNDSEMDWIFAKMWLRNADTQWHQVSLLFVSFSTFPGFKLKILSAVWKGLILASHVNWLQSNEQIITQINCKPVSSRGKA